jgi:hypothetical protein
MEQTNKIRVTQEYQKLSDDIKEQIKLVYPDGYSQYLIPFTNKEGKQVYGLRFETDEKIYLIRMTYTEAENIISNDDDYDDNGYLKEGIKDEYEDKYSDVEYLADNDNYDDD